MGAQHEILGGRNSTQTAIIKIISAFSAFSAFCMDEILNVPRPIVNARLPFKSASSNLFHFFKTFINFGETFSFFP